MKKVLFVATVVGHIRAFHLPILKWLQENGWETHVAAKADSALVNNVEYCNVFHNIDLLAIDETRQLNRINYNKERG